MVFLVLQFSMNVFDEFVVFVVFIWVCYFFFFFSSRRRHTRYIGDWSSDVCSSDLFGSLATTGQAKYRDPFMPLMPGVEFVRYNDVDDLRKKFDSSVCAIGLEVVQGEGGIRFMDKQFLQAARSLANKHRALLVIDEIQSGLGRTGKMFAYQHYGISPDIVTIAKP